MASSGSEVPSRTTERRSGKLRDRVERLLAVADVRVDGERPWDIQVNDDEFFERALTDGALGLGESYMDGWWECERLDEFICRILEARLETRVRPAKELWWVAKARLFNLQKRSRAFQVGRRHYDIGNELYQRMLDRRMTYSCGYWRDARTLDEAQEAKLDLVCRKLYVEPGMRVLDIGCGWGAMAKFAAERYGAEVVGITVSEEQAKLAREVCRGLPVQIRLEDYRDFTGSFDRVLSLGMFEHVGYKNYRTFMSVVRECLADDGLFLLHTIGGNESVRRANRWTERYIFPNSMLPSAKQIATAAEGLFVLEDWHNFGADYDKTLMCWHRNFEESWPELAERYDEGFYRMWRYYLLSSAGSFRARKNQLWQIVLSPHGVAGGYTSLR